MKNQLVSAAVTAAEAALNNAEWCDIICRSHGIAGAFEASLWASQRRTPPLHPDAVTLDPGATAGRVLGLVDHASPGCSVKDSFSSLELSSAGFHILFEAEWIARRGEPQPSGHRNPGRWRRIRTPDRLRAWTSAWPDGKLVDGLFQPSLLSRPEVAIHGRFRGDAVEAGFLLNRGRSVVGVTNLFSLTGAPADTWSACIAAAARLAPGHPVVGYESGAALAAAEEVGFEPIGALRVWIAD
jgi:hypothetical protein